MSSKVAAYLQEHIQGEVSVNPAVLASLSGDGSILSMTPEIVVYPRATSDIRKVARFAWQLSEKGHTLGLTTRGNGTDQTGAAIGKGIIISTPAHLNHIYELDVKQKLVRLQPGVGAKALSDALSLHGLSIPALENPAAPYSTVGGAIANNDSGLSSSSRGKMSAWVDQLEVVLANGDILQTSRISKRELAKKKGMSTFEGDIYRGIDNLITDNQEIIASKIAGDWYDNVGYSAIADVKHKDGSFDLTPLFVGSQGTLGIVSEAILKSEFLSLHHGVMVASFASSDAARDAIDRIVKMNPHYLEYFDAGLFEAASAQGKIYDWYKAADFAVEAVLLVGFNDFSERSNNKKLKKLAKQLRGEGISMALAVGDEANELLAMREVTVYASNPSGKGESAPALFDGAFIPGSRFEEFLRAVEEFAGRNGLSLPCYSRILEGTVFMRPTLELHKVSDRQKALKLIDEFAELVNTYGGHLIGEAGEGRLKANAAYASIEEDVLQLFTDIKAIFDPNTMLNPGVKQRSDHKTLVSELRSDFVSSVPSSYIAHM